MGQARVNIFLILFVLDLLFLPRIQILNLEHKTIFCIQVFRNLLVFGLVFLAFFFFLDLFHVHHWIVFFIDGFSDLVLAWGHELLLRLLRWLVFRVSVVIVGVVGGWGLFFGLIGKRAIIHVID